MTSRLEHDAMGEVAVPADRLWGAQTQRSVENFPIGVGHETMPDEIITAFGILKLAAARANRTLLPGKMTEEKFAVIARAAEEVRSGAVKEHFPLVVWQTGSGTQTNMNVNEVIANRANALAGKALCHPNDDVNMSQSSERENAGIVKSGRTHLQDAVPIAFSQEISGWRASLERDLELLHLAVRPLYGLALGGTAVGTGLNAPEGFAEKAAEEVAGLTGRPFVSEKNKFHALSSRDELVFAHGAVKALAGDMMKIANDVRWLASGPRCGLGEITIPANEPGSSIMPGKVNPTQCEQVTMVAVQVMGNDTAVGIAASQGNFELNVFLPVIAYNFLQSVRLTAESVRAFTARCVRGIRANRERMKWNLDASLMTVTALSPTIGYENAAKCAKLAFDEDLTLKEACLKLGLLTPERFDALYRPEEMI